MNAIEPNWHSLLVFLPAWLLCCSGFFYLSGSLPPSAAPIAVRTGIGPTLIWLNLIVIVMLCLVTLCYAFHELRLTTLIIAGGFVFLFAPFTVQDLPLTLKESQAGHALLLCLSAIGLILTGQTLVVAIGTT